MKTLFTLLLIFFTMCNSNHLPAQNFSGSFKGGRTGITSSADLTVNNLQVSGNLVINGKSGRVSGTLNDSLISGNVYDLETQQNYAYSGKFTANELHFNIVFPELNNQVVELIMQRETALNSSGTQTDASEENKVVNKTVAKTKGAKNPMLVGLWRNTEMLSSGSGSNYYSFSTDYFMEFNADGTFLSWTGSSAGSGYEAQAQSKANADKGEWYTEGKNLYLIDPLRNQKASVLFYADAEKMMIHNGGEEKKIYQRVE